MDIHIITKDQLEAQGIRWTLESHIAGARVFSWESVPSFLRGTAGGNPQCIILDMDAWNKDEYKLGDFLRLDSVFWIGISSERIFQTAWQALQYRAEDVLFRPLSAEMLIKRISQLRYRLRNVTRNKESARENGQALAVEYPDLFLTERQESHVEMASFLTPDPADLPHLYHELQEFPFTGRTKLFALSDFILAVRDAFPDEGPVLEYQAFLAGWKERKKAPLAIIMKTAEEGVPVKEAYRQIRQLNRRIFYEGYDIIAVEKVEEAQELDPFLTPLEQRQWVEMLERRAFSEVRQWVEAEFLTYEAPYPDSELVRIRLTSVLAQVRRYMKSRQFVSSRLEMAYHHVFSQIIHQPVIYQIINELLLFIAGLFREYRHETGEIKQSLIEKAKELIEANYWDARWNLSACADTLRMNKSTFSRRFRSESGENFLVVLHQVRIREAKRLLKETDLPLDEVSRLTGYTHQTYFNAKFKSLEGRTPTAFRSGVLE